MTVASRGSQEMSQNEIGDGPQYEISQYALK